MQVVNICRQCATALSTSLWGSDNGYSISSKVPYVIGFKVL